MTKNDSYTVVHHYIDSLSNVKFMTMISCIVLVIIIVVVLMIILAFVAFLLLRKYKIEPQGISNPQGISCETLRESSTHSVQAQENSIHCPRKNLPCTSAINPAANFDDEIDITSNVQNIAMSSVNPRLENLRNDSFEASPDLCNILFPTEHEEEIVSESPPKLMAFAGRVFASTRRKSRVSRNESKVSKSESKQSSRERKPSNTETHNTPLEWDYFESIHLGASNPSDRSEIIEKNTIHICWV